MTFHKIYGYKIFFVKAFGHGKNYFVVSGIDLHVYASRVCFVCVFKKGKSFFHSCEKYCLLGSLVLKSLLSSAM